MYYIQFDIESRHWTCIQESSDPRPADETNMAMGDHDGNQNNNNNNMIVPGAAPGRGVGGGVRGRVPSRRFGYVSVVHENKLVLFGGFDGSRWLNDMYVFDFATRIWEEVQAQGVLPSVRSCPAWAKDDTHVYIQGGYDGVERKDDFFACDLSTYTWIQMPSMGITPSPRYFHSCCLCE
jgi:leucine-zipper-like transcriptional regulator 1